MTEQTNHRLSLHFTRRCGCGADTVDADLIDVLEAVRIKFGLPVTVMWGMRCPVHKAKAGGATLSAQMIGKAADIQVARTHPDDVADYLETISQWRNGIGRYDDWTHIDVRHHPARWDRRS